MSATEEQRIGADEPIFDSTGTARAYIGGGAALQVFSVEGRMVALLHRDDVYSLNGHHLGWYVNGVLYDHEGVRVGFRRDTCPALRLAEPTRPVTRPNAATSGPVLQPSPARPPLGPAISGQSLEDFFKGGSPDLN